MLETCDTVKMMMATCWYVLLCYIPTPGLVMAAELSSTVEPLTHVATLPGHKFMDFLGQFKGREKFTKSDIYTPEPPNTPAPS